MPQVFEQDGKVRVVSASEKRSVELTPDEARQRAANVVQLAGTARTHGCPHVTLFRAGLPGGRVNLDVAYLLAADLFGLACAIDSEWELDVNGKENPAFVVRLDPDLPDVQVGADSVPSFVSA